MACLLVRHGLRADHYAQLGLERQYELEAQSRAFAKLASKAALFDPTDSKSLGELTQIGAETLKIRRTSVWHLDDRKQHLTCSDSYDCKNNGHTQGTVLALDDFPSLFEILLKGEPIIVTDAGHDPRTSKLYQIYLQPLGCESLLMMPIIHKDQIGGAIWFEHESKSHEWASEYISFAQAIACMLAVRMVADSKHTVAIDPIELETVAKVQLSLPKQHIVPRQEMRTTSIGGMFEKQLSTLDNIGADVFSDATVLVLQFTDPISLAMRLDGTDSTTAIDHLVCHLEDLASSHGIEYLKIMSNQIMCVTGFDSDSKKHTHLIAELALAIQEQCNRMFANLDGQFRIGINRIGVNLEVENEQNR